MDNGFEKLKQEIEAEMGRPIGPDEEHTLKGLFYFSKAVKLKNQVESEPEQVGKICERVLEDIGARMKRHQARVIEATKDFMSSKQSRNKKPSKQKTEQGRLLF